MRFFSVLAAVFLLVAVTPAALGQAAQTTTITMQGDELGMAQGAKVEPTKVTGSATIEAAGAGIKVNVKLNGLNANQQSAGHIHKGKCGEQGPVVFPLNAIAAGANGSGSMDITLGNVPYSEVTSGAYYIQYHIGVTPPGRQISCGNIVAAATGGQGGQGMTQLPRSGAGGAAQRSGGEYEGWLAVLVGLGLLGAAGLRVVRRFGRR